MGGRIHTAYLAPPHSLSLWMRAGSVGNQSCLYHPHRSDVYGAAWTTVVCLLYIPDACCTSRHCLRIANPITHSREP